MTKQSPYNGWANEPTWSARMWFLSLPKVTLEMEMLAGDVADRDSLLRFGMFIRKYVLKYCPLELDIEHVNWFELAQAFYDDSTETTLELI